jgi:glycosyltransferase involved in cell wall biosynthesis
MGNPRIYIAAALFYPLVGGVQRQVLEQARSLRKSGYQATILTLRYEKAWPRYEVMQGVPVIRVAGSVLGGREKLPRVLQKLCYLMALIIMGYMLWKHRQRYDILHVYQLSILALPTALACLLTGKPMIISVRNADSGRRKKSKKVSLIAGPLDASATWLHVVEPRPEGTDLEGLARFGGKPVVLLVRFLLQYIDAVVVVLSTRMIIYLNENDFHLPNVQLIPNGVDTTRFTPITGEPTIYGQAQTVTCISRLCYQKGIDILLQAWNIVHRQAPQARLILVGDGPLRPQFEQMAQALGITDSVEFAGMQNDVPAQLRRSGMCALSSRWEGMPNAILEAMAYGLPCIATRVSGSEDIIQHGLNGLLVEPEDYQGMAQALLTLLCDPLLAHEYGRAAREAIEKHYSLESIIDRYIVLYQRMANSPRKIAKDTSSSKINHLSS